MIEFDCHEQSSTLTCRFLSRMDSAATMAVTEMIRQKLDELTGGALRGYSQNLGAGD